MIREKPKNTLGGNVLLTALVLLVVLTLVLFSIFFLTRSMRRPAVQLPPLQVKFSYQGAERYSNNSGAWAPVKRDDVILPNESVRTGPDSEVEMSVADAFVIKLKENSEIKVETPEWTEQGVRYPVRLLTGTVIAAVEPGVEMVGGLLLRSNAYQVVAIRPSSFGVQIDKTKNGQVAVLSGDVLVYPPKRQKAAILMREHQKIEVTKGKRQLSPVPISETDWANLKEAYEMIPKTAALEAKQLDLSLEAGDFFEYVFDHGTFYSPRIGFAMRTFEKEEGTGDVVLQLDYDVFPRAAVVGMYIKTRDFDLEHFEGLSFDVRRLPDEPHPMSYLLELKSKWGVLRAVRHRGFDTVWKKVTVPFVANQPTPVSEVTIVFTNDTVGEFKKGKIQFRNFQLLPKRDPEKFNADTDPAVLDDEAFLRVK